MCTFTQHCLDGETNVLFLLLVVTQQCAREGAGDDRIKSVWSKSAAAPMNPELHQSRLKIFQFPHSFISIDELKQNMFFFLLKQHLNLCTTNSTYEFSVSVLL